MRMDSVSRERLDQIKQRQTAHICGSVQDGAQLSARGGEDNSQVFSLGDIEEMIGGTLCSSPPIC